MIIENKSVKYTYKCDRCSYKQDGDGHFIPSYWLVLNHSKKCVDASGNNDTEHYSIHLCPSCKGDFNKWMKL